MSGESGYFASLQRGILLRDHGRFAEASSYFAEAIAKNPNGAQAYYEQAHCYCNWGNARAALRYLDRAQQLSPEAADFFVLRAWILSCRPLFSRKALTAVNRALELNPHSPFAFTTKARIYSVGCYWKQTEEAARDALRIDPRNDYGANLLAIALREQGRIKESREVIEGILQRVPEGAFGHANAGWTALQTGDHERACAHFLEALRIDPLESLARTGLPHALIQRAWTYRLIFRWRAFYLGQPLWRRMLILIGIFGVPVFGIPILTAGLSGSHFDAALAVLMCFLAVGLVFFFTRPLGRLCLLSHPLLIYSTKPQDRIGSLFGFIQFATLLFLLGFLAWPAAVIGGLLAVWLIYSIRRPEIASAHKSEPQAA